MVVISQFCIAKNSHLYFWILTIENVALRWICTTICFSIDFNIQQTADSRALQFRWQNVSFVGFCYFFFYLIFLLFLAFLLIVLLVLWPLAIEWRKKTNSNSHYKMYICMSIYARRLHFNFNEYILYMYIFISNRSTSIMLSLILALYHSLSAHVMYY